MMHYGGASRLKQTIILMVLLSVVLFVNIYPKRYRMPLFYGSQSLVTLLINKLETITTKQAKTITNKQAKNNNK